MSSATSTKSAKGSFHLKTDAARADTRGPRLPPVDGAESETDAGFKPWHFFVLVSLAAATVAVVMSRQATPEHLILISAIIGAAGAAAGALYRTLAPLAVRDVTLLSQRQSDRARTALEREKALVLRSIKELEFDRAMGKVSPRDFDEMSARLRARAMMLIKRADEGASGYTELIERELSARMVTRARPAAILPPAPADAEVELEPDNMPDAVGPDRSFAVRGTEADGRQCAECGTGNDVDAAFCKRCGTRLEALSV